jgi:protein dithiol oxidoreductase (disulfide-forming)
MLGGLLRFILLRLFFTKTSIQKALESLMRIVAALVVALVSFSAFAADSAATKPTVAPVVNYLEGKDYILLDEPVRPQDPSKIEVAEVFSYLCGHCFHFEPLASAWAKTQKPDVAFVQVHASWSTDMMAYQRGYYTATLLKVKDKSHQATFDRIHREGKELATAESWADFLSAYGVTKQAVLSSYNSFAVNSLLAQADARVRGYKISSTPELIVDGKYRVTSRLVASHEDMLKVAQFLVNKVRAERATKK